jgi:hypothetical protein
VWQVNGTCYGGIPKDVWYGPNRGDACVSAFEAQVLLKKVNSSTVGIDLCDLDASLNAMCVNLATARKLVQEGNCIYTGACSPQVYVYTPSMYSITNQDFVRGTVTAFYEMYGNTEDGQLQSFMPGSTSTMVCPLDVDQADLIARNNAYTAKCASVQLGRLQVNFVYFDFNSIHQD